MHRKIRQYQWISKLLLLFIEYQDWKKWHQFFSWNFFASIDSDFCNLIFFFCKSKKINHFVFFRSLLLKNVYAYLLINLFYKKLFFALLVNCKQTVVTVHINKPIFLRLMKKQNEMSKVQFGWTKKKSELKNWLQFSIFNIIYIIIIFLKIFGWYCYILQC